MVAFEEKGASSAPQHEHETLNHGAHSDTSSAVTRTENDANLEKSEDVAPRESHHARFGDNQVFAPETTHDSDELPGAEKVGTYDKIELTEDMCYDELGYSYPEWKKW